MSLLWRLFAPNAALLLAAGLLLAASPATVSSPILLEEAIVIVAVLAAMLLVNLAVIRRALEPLERLTATMRRVDLLRPGERLPELGAGRETAELRLAFNSMLDRLEVERRESTRRTLAAQEDERRRVAAELHDEVSQSLTALVLQIRRTAGQTDGAVRRDLLEMQQSVRSTVADVGRIVRRLRPEALDDLGLAQALTSLVQRVSEQTGIEVHREFAPDVPDLTREQELVIYRVAQEALTNAIRHSGASRIALRVAAGPATVHLEVQDDGIGIEPNDISARHGIQGMRERALLIGSRLEIGKRLEGGTEVRLEIPMVDPS